MRIFKNVIEQLIRTHLKNIFWLNFSTFRLQSILDFLGINPLFLVIQNAFRSKFYKIALKTIFEIGSDIIFPKLCLGCDKEGIYVCDACLSSIQLHKEFTCPFCMRLSYFGMTCKYCLKERRLEGMWIVCEYRALVRKMVLALKFKNIQELKPSFQYTFMRFFHTFIEPQSVRISFDCIIPVPLHRFRLHDRGFNQSEIFSEMIGSIIDIPTCRGILIKKRNTQRQAVLKKKKRLSNLRNAFLVREREKILGKVILLVDDVTTTGATLEECAKTLKAAGAKTVWAIVFARSM